MRYTAPADITCAFLSIGPVSVVDGAIDVPDDLSDGDRKGLATAGFTLAPIVIAPAPARAPAPAKEA